MKTWLISYEKQSKKNLKNIKKISEILQSHVETTNQKPTKMTEEIFELPKYLEFTQKEVKGEITNIKFNSNQVKIKIQKLG